MQKQRSNQWRASWPKAVVPGSAVSCLLLFAWVSGWAHAISPISIVLLTTAWLAGVAWAFMPPLSARRSQTHAAQAEDHRAELNAMAVSIAAAFAEEISRVRAEVKRTGSIVREAVEGLSLSFRELGASTREVQENRPESERHDAVASVRRAPSPLHESDRFDGGVARAVRYLQFEDIATQSLAAADDHLLCLDRLDTLMQRVLELEPGMDPEQLEHLQADIRESIASCKNTGVKVVQETMAGGEVELF